MTRRLGLLGGQAAALGLAMAFLVVPTGAILLTTYGARALPYAYLCVAAAGATLSALVGRVRRRWSLSRVAVALSGAQAAIVGCAWILLQVGGATWVTFPLLVVFALGIPVGLVLVTQQADRLLDVHGMRADLPRVLVGLPGGVAVGGLLAAWLVGPLGGPGPLLGLATAASLALLALIVVTARTYPALSVVPTGSRGMVRTSSGPGSGTSPRQLLAHRLVALVLGYQVLSAVVTQLLEYMVWERAADRYPDAADLARFLGTVGAVVSAASVAFMLVLAGRLLARHGIRFGLAANPAGVLVLLAVTAVTGYLVGPASAAFLLLVCGLLLVDTALTDGTTRTSISATYQALPAALRSAVQGLVEGVGIPLALGFVGVLLLVMQALQLGVVALVVVTAVIAAAWLWLARATYAGYRASLQSALTRREWDPVDLRLDDESRGAILALVADGDLRDLRLGLDVLLDTDSPDLALQVAGPLADSDPERRLVAVSVAGRALRASHVHGWVGPALEPLRDDPDERVRTAVDIALAGVAGSEQRARATRRWADALVAGDPSMVPGALEAAAALPDPEFIPGLVALATMPAAPAALADALRANAGFLAGPTQEGLRGTADLPWPAVRRLVVALGESRTDSGRSVLLEHLEHPDPAVADAVLEALALGGPVPSDQEDAVRRALAAEARRASRMRASLDVLDGVAGSEHVVRGLRDEVARASRRTVTLVCLLHDPTMIVRTVEQLGGSPEVRDLARESLEAVLTPELLPVVLALVDPALDPGERSALLGALGLVEVSDDPILLLSEIVEDPRERWRDAWLRACALHALAGLAPGRARGEARRFVRAPDAVTAETAAWVLAEVPPA